MNKDLFKINSDEVKRILTLHEERTKTQYLNIISEQLSQDNSSFTLLSDITLQSDSLKGEMDLKLYKGAKFVKSTRTGHLESNTTYARPQNLTGNVSKSDNKKGKVFYNCKTGKFFLPNVNVSFYEEIGAHSVGEKFLTKDYLKTVCGSKEGDYKSGGVYSLNNGQFTIPKSTKFTKTKNGAFFKANYYTGNQIQLGTYNTPLINSVNVAFSCTDSKYYINNSGYTEDNGNILTNKLKSLYCVSNTDPNKKQDDSKLIKAQKCGHKTWEEYQDSGWKCTPTSSSVDTQPVVNTPKLTPKQQEFVNKTSSLTNNIQKLLGVTPTGQLDTTQIDTLINKLKGQ